MGRNKKKILGDFIDSIPDSKLKDLPEKAKTLHKDGDLRVDMQGMTTATKTTPRQHNLQVQVNAKPKTTSLRPYAPNTVAGPVLVPENNPMTPAQIRQGFRDSSKF